MGAYMREQNVRCTVPGYCFTIFHDGEYKESDIDVEICEAVVAPGRDTKKIKFIRTRGIPRCLPYSGDQYSTIGLAYSTVMKWIEETVMKSQVIPGILYRRVLE